MELPRANLEERVPAWLLEFHAEPYRPMWDLQHRLAQSRQRDEIPDTLILLEHEPVITLGRRASQDHILATPEVLRQAGISVHRVERGGDVTYHGPGQLVGYPILRLADHGLGVGDYMHLLEEITVHTLSDFGLLGTRREDTIGVWLGANKVAAFGARVERGVTYHGFALNVDPNLEHYAFIIPCGITDGSVTSMRRELEHPVSMSQIRARVQYWFSELFHVNLELVPQARIDQSIGNDSLCAAP